MRKFRRYYTKKSYKLMKIGRVIILILFSPIWIPLLFITYIGTWLEDVLDVLDDVLDKFLDKVIPQIK